MAKYTFHAMVTVSVYTVVEAATEEDARDEAEGRQMQSLCHSCESRESNEAWALNGGLDGEPENIEIDERSE